MDGIYLVFIISFYLYLIIAFILPFFWKFIVAQNKLNFVRYHEEQAKKNLPVILYLRAFGTDGTGREWQPSLLMPFANLMGFQISTFEYNLFLSIYRLGHFIAIGKPGENLPELGFYRKYFKDDEWQDNVTQLMNESAMIIFRPDSSDGVMFEYEKILTQKHKNKLLIWTQMGDIEYYPLQKARYNIFRRKAYEKFKEKLPELKQHDKFLYYSDEGKVKWASSISSTPLYIKILQPAPNAGLLPDIPAQAKEDSTIRSNPDVNGDCKKTKLLELNNLIRVQQRKMFGGSITREIQNLLNSLGYSKQEATNLLNDYTELFKNDLVQDLIKMNSSYDHISRNVSFFTDWGIIDDTFPHAKKKNNNVIVIPEQLAAAAQNRQKNN